MIKGIVQNGQELPKMDQNDQNGPKLPKKSHPKINAKSALKLKSIYKSKIVKIMEIVENHENVQTWPKSGNKQNCERLEECQNIANVPL